MDTPVVGFVGGVVVELHECQPLVADSPNPKNEIVGDGCLCRAGKSEWEGCRRNGVRLEADEERGVRRWEWDGRVVWVVRGVCGGLTHSLTATHSLTFDESPRIHLEFCTG